MLGIRYEGNWEEVIEVERMLVFGRKGIWRMEGKPFSSFWINATGDHVMILQGLDAFAFYFPEKWAWLGDIGHSDPGI